MNRTPPSAVRKTLREEVGFACPVPGCANPYLEWHHFDPPWSVEEHHNPDGMIALCSEHHNKADAGAFTVEQLIHLKRNAKSWNNLPEGKFDWMRNKLLAVIGGNFYLGHLKSVLSYEDDPLIWFNRDSPYAVCPHPKSFSLREKDFPTEERIFTPRPEGEGQGVRAENDARA